MSFDSVDIPLAQSCVGHLEVTRRRSVPVASGRDDTHVDPPAAEPINAARNEHSDLWPIDSRKQTAHDKEFGHTRMRPGTGSPSHVAIHSSDGKAVSAKPATCSGLPMGVRDRPN